MLRDPRAFLWDARDAALAIQAFTKGMDSAAYAANAMAQAAVERKFEVIGEALSQLSRIDTALASRVPDLARIVAFRNQLIHGYASVNVGTVWNVLTSAIPPLLSAIQSMLDDAEPE